MDSMGKEYSIDDLREYTEVNILFLKLINVPTMFDIISSMSNPQTDFLTLTMIDS